ncbi:MAG TPA: iron ABC transporter permease [Rhodothermales bacterium]|nr:iron ABC transporter permease [Rhodothermales bacterium]
MQNRSHSPIWLFSALLTAGMLLPLLFLLLNALRADEATLAEVFTARTWLLFRDTLLLMLAVVAFVMVLAFPLAWITTRTNMPGRQILTWLGALPLAFPGYVMAYALLAIGGDYGMSAQLLNISIPRFYGFWGACLALTITLYPYLFLNLRTALLGLDPSIEESARSLGMSVQQSWFRIILPQLRPALLSGSLLVALHVLGDFGVVSLMRYRTFSFVLYQATEMSNPVAVACLALIPLGITLILLWIESRQLKELRLDTSSRATKRRFRLHEIGYFRWLAWAVSGIMAFITVVLPLLCIGFWGLQSRDTTQWKDLLTSLWASTSVALPSAVSGALFALLLAYGAVRYPSFQTRLFERLAYMGYATPPVVFGLAFIAFALGAVPFLYQTMILLVFAYVFHALAEAIGPVRSSLFQASPRIQEAARSLGVSGFSAFRKVTLPLLKRGLLMSMAFVFLSIMKELPITLLLAPIGFESLAMNVWQYTTTANFAAAAPYALAIVTLSSIFVGLLLHREKA